MQSTPGIRAEGSCSSEVLQLGVLCAWCDSAAECLGGTPLPSRSALTHTNVMQGKGRK